MAMYFGYFVLKNSRFCKFHWVSVPGKLIYSYKILAICSILFFFTIILAKFHLAQLSANTYAACEE